MDLGLAGKNAIVTGGGSNIGMAIVTALAKEGANVAIADIDEVQAEKVAKQISAAVKGSRILVVKTDATNYDSVQAMVKKVLEEFKKIDILVNNLGWDELHLFAETGPAFWDKVIALNYRSMIHCTHAVLPHMIAQKSGAIISIGSDAGRMGEFREGVYGGCKGAVIALTKTIARENGRYGIRANVVCPGMTVPASADVVGDKSMWKGTLSFTPEQLEKAAQAYPLRKLGKAEDIGYAVAFFASSVAAGHITGQTLSVSGGYTMM